MLVRAAEVRAMAMTARDKATFAALISLAERFEALAATRLELPVAPDGTSGPDRGGRSGP